MKSVAGFILLACVAYILFSVTVAADSGLTIVATFPGLADDINLIKCDSDRVYSLLPATADPHEYYLRPSDLEMLRQADLIISTAHTHFELEISELVARGELNATLIEIPKIEGIKILKNPATLMDNLHTPTYDPQNYMIFLNNVSKLMGRLNPSCHNAYEVNYELLKKRVESLINSKPRPAKTLIGMATEPVAQYAVEWLGINLSKLLIPEEGLSPTPATILEIENSVKNHEIDVLVVVENGTYSSYLINLGREHHVPIIEVPPPYESGSTLDKLNYVLTQYVSLQNLEVLNRTAGQPNLLNVTHAVLVLAVLSLALVIVVYAISRGG